MRRSSLAARAESSFRTGVPGTLCVASTEPNPAPCKRQPSQAKVIRYVTGCHVNSNAPLWSRLCLKYSYARICSIGRASRESATFMSRTRRLYAHALLRLYFSRIEFHSEAGYVRQRESGVQRRRWTLFEVVVRAHFQYQVFGQRANRGRLAGDRM